MNDIFAPVKKECTKQDRIVHTSYLRYKMNNLPSSFGSSLLFWFLPVTDIMVCQPAPQTELNSQLTRIRVHLRRRPAYFYGSVILQISGLKITGRDCTFMQRTGYFSKKAELLLFVNVYASLRSKRFQSSYCAKVRAKRFQSSYCAKVRAEA